jgi:spermidine synthase
MQSTSPIKKLLLTIKPKSVYKSKDGHIEVRDAVENGRTVRVLYCDGVRESGIYLDDGMDRDPLFFYMQTLKEVVLFYEGLDNALLIGGGGMAFPKYYLNCMPMGRIDVLEKDSRYIELAKEYFFYKEDDRVRVIEGDGASFISKTAMSNASANSDPDMMKYDLIIFDAFDGNKPPKELFSESIYKLVRQIMSSGGILALNMLNEKPGVISMQTHLAQAVLKNIYKNTKIIACQMGWNCILLASDRAL